jgi:hypothetical protein
MNVFAWQQPLRDSQELQFYVTELWQNCGYRLLRKGDDGRLHVTDDYLRLYYGRPELAPPAEAEAAEHALHASLMESPRRAVPEAEIAALADPDARENYRVMMRFRTRLLDAPNIEAFYAGLFQRDVVVPPDFIHHTAQVILRSVLDGTKDGLEARAAELFFRKQRVTIQDGAVMAADDETVQMHAQTGGFGNLGKLLKEAQTSTRSVDLDVLDEKNAEYYFERDEAYDTVLQLNTGRPGCAALCRVLERWIAHFHGVRTTVTPVREIADEDWLWHVGLDAEATTLLNEVYSGADVDEERMKRIVGLFRVDFADPGALRPENAGSPVFLGMAVTPDGVLRMKPQNLLVNLPLAARA